VYTPPPAGRLTDCSRRNSSYVAPVVAPAASSTLPTCPDRLCLKVTSVSPPRVFGRRTTVLRTSLPKS
jgi:hypothetical protein